MASKSSSASDKAYHAAYQAKQTWKVNRERRLRKLLKTQPNNKQIEKALANLQYRRKTPGTRFWTQRTKNLAKQFTDLGYKAPKELFSTNAKVSATAQIGSVVNTSAAGKVSFKLGARCHGDFSSE